MPTKDSSTEKGKSGRRLLLALVILLVTVGVVFYFLVRIRHIEAGYIGVKASIDSPIDNSSEYDISEVRGYVIYMPLYTDLRIYPTTIQTASYNSININTNDGMIFVVKPRISYQLDEQKSVLFYKNHKESLDKIQGGYLKEIIANAYVNAAANFNSDSLSRNRSGFESNAYTILASKMTESGLILRNANSNLEVPEKIKELVELRNITIQNTLLATERFQETYTKANILRIEDSLRNSALTSLAIQKMFIEKWDGKLISTEREMPQIFKDTLRIK